MVHLCLWMFHPWLCSPLRRAKKRLLPCKQGSTQLLPVSCLVRCYHAKPLNLRLKDGTPWKSNDDVGTLTSAPAVCSARSWAVECPDRALRRSWNATIPLVSSGVQRTRMARQTSKRKTQNAVAESFPSSCLGRCTRHWALVSISCPYADMPKPGPEYDDKDNVKPDPSSRPPVSLMMFCNGICRVVRRARCSTPLLTSIM